MINNKKEYQKAVQNLKDEYARINETKTRLKEQGLTDEQIKRVIDPLESFHLQFKEEVESYEKLKQGIFEELQNLKGLGHMLVSLRIAQGLSQKELAKRLGIKESQISRDEKNEYHGITLDRANKILEALNVTLHTKVDVSVGRNFNTYVL
jgi:ribosome-binding protein aMBF1 (putative translation factor)